MGVKEDPLKPKGANQKLYKTFKKRSYLHAQITMQNVWLILCNAKRNKKYHYKIMSKRNRQKLIGIVAYLLLI